MMMDLSVNSNWRNFDLDPPEVGQYFFAIGKICGYDEYMTIAKFPKMLMMTADPIYKLNEGGGYHYTGELSNPYVIICNGCDKFSPGGTSNFEIEFWIDVGDLLPTFLKNSNGNSR